MILIYILSTGHQRNQNGNDRHGSTPSAGDQHRKERMIMAKGYVIYNPLAGNGGAGEDVKLLQMVLDEDMEY